MDGVTGKHMLTRLETVPAASRDDAGLVGEIRSCGLLLVGCGYIHVHVYASFFGLVWCCWGVARCLLLVACC